MKDHLTVALEEMLRACRIMQAAYAGGSRRLAPAPFYLREAAWHLQAARA